MGIAGLGDAKMLSVLCAGMIPWNQPEIGSKTLCAFKTIEITNLGEQCHSSVGFHPNEALQFRCIFLVLLHLRERLDSGVVQLHLFLELVEADHVLLQHLVHNGVTEVQLMQPIQMLL